MSRVMYAFCFIFVAAAFSAINVVSAQPTITATCVIANMSGVYPIYGVINLEQPATGGDTTIRVSIEGFGSPELNKTNKHGFHVHENGNIGNNCLYAGGHYNPRNKPHGGPSDTERHVGDLGNIEADSDGTVNTTITDSMVSLIGNETVINRAFVVHKDEDDLGRGNFPDSNTTGHAGPRYGCCIIENTTVEMTTAGPGGPVNIVETTTSSTSVVSLSAALVIVTGILLLLN